MMLGAILDSETPLRRRVESALNLKFSPSAGKRSKTRDANASLGVGRHGMTVLTGSAWIAVAISLAISLVVAAGALHAFDAVAEQRVLEFVDHHRLLVAALVLGSQLILLLAITAYGSHGQQLKNLLSDTQRQITDTVGAAEVGLWRWSAETKLLWLTDQAREILKLAPATAYDPAQSVTLLHPDDLPRLRDAVIAASKSGESFDMNIRLACEEARPARWLRCRGLSQTDAEGRITRIDGTLVDISERVAMQTEINRQRQSLIHLSRVGTIGKLSGALAHELSQPLTAIMNNAYAIDRMLRQKPVNISEVRDAISDIIEDDSRVNAVISHLRALLKKDNADFGPVDMTLLIHKVLGLVRKELALHRVKPVIAIAPDFPAVWGDEVQLQQLLLNLIMNAVDAIGANGKGSGSLSITAHADGASGTYHLCVSDTGGGFKPAVVEKLFEPFFSTKEQGLGLGLSISQAIVNGHNGTIRAENNTEGGATFHVTLPMTDGKHA
jgi:signal transduction histidine kinase